MVLETAAPANNEWHLVAENKQFKAAHGTTDNLKNAMFDKPLERLAEPAIVAATTTTPAIDWTPVYESADNWYYVSSVDLTFAQAERASAIVGGGLFCNTTLNRASCPPSVP